MNEQNVAMALEHLTKVAEFKDNGAVCFVPTTPDLPAEDINEAAMQFFKDKSNLVTLFPKGVFVEGTKMADGSRQFNLDMWMMMVSDYGRKNDAERFVVSGGMKSAVIGISQDGMTMAWKPDTAIPAMQLYLSNYVQGCVKNAEWMKTIAEFLIHNAEYKESDKLLVIARWPNGMPRHTNVLKAISKFIDGMVSSTDARKLPYVVVAPLFQGEAMHYVSFATTEGAVANPLQFDPPKNVMQHVLALSKDGFTITWKGGDHDERLAVIVSWFHNYFSIPDTDYNCTTLSTTKVKSNWYPWLKLRNARCRQNLSYAQLSEKSGLSVDVISSLERQNAHITKEQAQALGKVLGLHHKFLLHRDR